VLLVLAQERSHIRMSFKGFPPKYPGPFKYVLDKDGKTLYPVLPDGASTVSATYGVAFQGFDATYNRPATFVIDREGIIRYEAKKGLDDQPTPEQLLKVIDGLGEKKPPPDKEPSPTRNISNRAH